MSRIRRAIGIIRRDIQPASRNGTNEEESQVKVGQARPSENQLNRIVNELELQHEFPEESLPTGPDPVPEYSSVNAGEQRTVEPPPPLRNKLWDSGGNICGCLGGFDVFERPRLPLLCYDLKTKDSIFSQVHVPLEQSRFRGTPVHSLALEITGKGTLTVGAVQQGFVPVGTECSGKDRDITKDTLGRRK